VKGGASDHSPWVAFERDYALRSKLAVFAYDMRTKKISIDARSPINLDLRMFCHQADLDRVGEVTTWLERRRNFAINDYLSRTQFGGIKGDHLVAFEELLKYGGVVVWFVSPLTQAMITAFNSEDFLEYCRDDPRFEDERLEARYSDLLDDLAPDDFTEAFDAVAAADKDPYAHVFQIFVRIDPSVPEDWTGRLPMLDHESPMIDVIGHAPPQGVDWSGADDLLVRIYAGKLFLKRLAAEFLRNAGLGA
jgi:hypothetical protein